MHAYTTQAPMSPIMAAVEDRFCLSLDFSSEKLGPDILWYNPPLEYKLRSNGSTGLKVSSVCIFSLVCFKYRHIILRSWSCIIKNVNYP